MSVWERQNERQTEHTIRVFVYLLSFFACTQFSLFQYTIFGYGIKWQCSLCLSLPPLPFLFLFLDSENSFFITKGSQMKCIKTGLNWVSVIFRIALCLMFGRKKQQNLTNKMLFMRFFHGFQRLQLFRARTFEGHWTMYGNKLQYLSSYIDKLSL